MTPERFKEIQQNLGWTNVEIAARLQVCARSIHYYRSGGRKISKPIALLLDVFTKEFATKPKSKNTCDDSIVIIG